MFESDGDVLVFSLFSDWDCIFPIFSTKHMKKMAKHPK